MNYQLQNNYVSYWNTSLTQIEGEELGDEVAVLSNEIETIKGQIETIQDDITTLQGQVATLESEVDTLQSQVATLQSQVATLQSQVATLQSQVATLQSDVATLQSDVSTIQSQITDIQADIVSIQAELSALYVSFYSIAIECETLKVNQSLIVKTTTTDGYDVNINGITQFGASSGVYLDGFDYYFGGIVFASDDAFYAMDKSLGGGQYEIGYYERNPLPATPSSPAWIRKRAITSSQSGWLAYGGLNSRIALGGNGKYLIVGDPLATAGGQSFAGRVHIFYSTSSASSPFLNYTETIITAPTPVFNDRFGNRVCMSAGSAYVIGISAESGGTGKLYEARATGAGGTFTVSQITAYTPSSGDLFGNAIDINRSGNALVATASSTVRVFGYAGSAWSLARTINTFPYSPQALSLAYSADLFTSGNLAVGFPFYSSSGYTQNGAVQIYNIVDGSTVSGILTASTKIDNDWFGAKLMFQKDFTNQNRLLITNFNSSTQTTSGSKVYVFDNSWIQTNLYSTYNAREASWYASTIAIPDYNTNSATNKFYISYSWDDRITAYVRGTLSATKYLYAERVYGVHYEDIDGAPVIPYGDRIFSYVYTGFTESINMADIITSSQSTRMRIRAWAGGGGGGSGAQQNANASGGTSATITGGSGAGSGAYFDIEISLTAVFKLDIFVGKGGDGGYGVSALTDGNAIAGVNGVRGGDTTLTFYGAYDPVSLKYAWTTTITIVGGSRGLGGATTNVARNGGAGGATSTSPFTVSEEFPARRAVAGVDGGDVTTYNTLTNGVTSGGNYGATGGGAGGGCNGAGTISVAGSKGGGVLWATAGMTEDLIIDERRAMGGGTNGGTGYDGRSGMDTGGVWSRGGGGGGGGGSALKTDIVTGGYGGAGGFPAGGGGGGGASKNINISGAGGNGADGFVLITVY